jgi:hypothetical protein
MNVPGDKSQVNDRPPFLWKGNDLILLEGTRHDLTLEKRTKGDTDEHGFHR